MSKLRPTTFFLLALALATVALAAFLFTNSGPFAPPPNYSLIEPGLYLGGSGPKPPEATAVLSGDHE